MKGSSDNRIYICKFCVFYTRLYCSALHFFLILFLWAGGKDDIFLNVVTPKNGKATAGGYICVRDADRGCDAGPLFCSVAIETAKGQVGSYGAYTAFAIHPTCRICFHSFQRDAASWLFGSGQSSPVDQYR